MFKLTLIITTLLLSSTSFASFRDARVQNRSAEAAMEGMIDIPDARMSALSCHRDNSNRDLCAIERGRLRTAEQNLRSFDGSASDAKWAARSDISNRESRMSELSCGHNRDNAGPCGYESQALWEVEQLLESIDDDRRRRDDRRGRDDRRTGNRR